MGGKDGLRFAHRAQGFGDRMNTTQNFIICFLVKTCQSHGLANASFSVRHPLKEYMSYPASAEGASEENLGPLF